MASESNENSRSAIKENELSGDRKDDEYVGVRSEIARFLGPHAFPGDAEKLMAVARDNNATDDVLRLLGDLPRDVTFQTTQDIVEHIPLS
jgi:hypothetical protein